MSLAELWQARRAAFQQEIAGARPVDTSTLVGREIAKLARAFSDLDIDDAQRAAGLGGLRLLEQAAVLPAATVATARFEVGKAGPAWLIRPGLGLMTVSSGALAAVMFADGNVAAGLALAFIALLGITALGVTARNAIARAFSSGWLGEHLPWRMRKLLGLRRARNTPPANGAEPVVIHYQVDAAALTDWLDQSMIMIDRLIAAVREPRSPDREGWPANVLLALRELVTAADSGDAALALLGAQQARGALITVGIVPVTFTPERSSWFELAPSGSKHERTSRPALVRQGDPDELLCRGLHLTATTR